jgi:hypothetical protein
MIGNMYNWAFPEEQIQAVNEAHRAEVAARNRVAQAAGTTRRTPRLGHLARLIRAWLRAPRIAPKPRFQP